MHKYTYTSEGTTVPPLRGIEYSIPLRDLNKLKLDIDSIKCPNNAIFSIGLALLCVAATFFATAIGSSEGTTFFTFSAKTLCLIICIILPILGIGFIVISYRLRTLHDNSIQNVSDSLAHILGGYPKEFDSSREEFISLIQENDSAWESIKFILNAHMEERKKHKTIKNETE